MLLKNCVSPRFKSKVISSGQSLHIRIWTVSIFGTELTHGIRQNVSSTLNSCRWDHPLKNCHFWKYGISAERYTEANYFQKFLFWRLVCLFTIPTSEEGHLTVVFSWVRCFYDTSDPKACYWFSHPILSLLTACYESGPYHIPPRMSISFPGCFSSLYSITLRQYPNNLTWALEDLHAYREWWAPNQTH